MTCFSIYDLTPISTTSGIWSTGNTRKYQQIDVYIYQCDIVLNEQLSSHIDSLSYSTHLPPFTFMSEEAVFDIFPVGDLM